MGHTFPKTWTKSPIITSSSSERTKDGSHIVSLPDGSTWQEKKKTYNDTGGYHKVLEEWMFF